MTNPIFPPILIKTIKNLMLTWCGHVSPKVKMKYQVLNGHESLQAWWLKSLVNLFVLNRYLRHLKDQMRDCFSFARYRIFMLKLKNNIWGINIKISQSPKISVWKYSYHQFHHYVPPGPNLVILAHNFIASWCGKSFLIFPITLNWKWVAFFWNFFPFAGKCEATDGWRSPT